VRGAAFVLGLGATLLAILLATEANLNRNEPKCRYMTSGAFTCDVSTPDRITWLAIK
jgi:hypothetical protein